MHSIPQAWTDRLASSLNAGKPQLLLARGTIRDSLKLWLNEQPEGSGWEVREYSIPDAFSSGPLAPLHSWLSRGWENLTAHERRKILTQAGFYAPHRIVLNKWLSGSQVCRHDELSIAEGQKNFEILTWFQALARLFILLCGTTPRLFIVRRAHLASQALIRFLRAVMDCDLPSSCIIILETEQQRSWQGPPQLELWPHLLKDLDDQDALLWINEMEDLQASSPGKEPSSGEDSPPVDELEKQKALFCLEDVIACIDHFGDRGNAESARLMLIRAECWSGLGNLAQAGLHIEDAVRSLEDPALQLRARLLSCRVSCWKHSEEEAQKALGAARRAASVLKDPGSKFACDMYGIFFEDIFGWDKDILPRIAGIKSLAQKAEFEAGLSYLESNVNLYDHMVREWGWENAELEAREALRRSRRSGNSYHRSVICHMLGYLNELAGRTDDALVWYKKGMRLRKRLDDPIELIKVYNGTGYFCFRTGRLTEALALYGKALVLMENMGDHQESCLTFLNMAQIYFYTGNFRESLLIFSSVLEIMDILGYTALPFFVRPKIQAFAAVSAWELGKISQAMEYRQGFKGFSPGRTDEPVILFTERLMKMPPGNMVDYEARFKAAAEQRLPDLAEAEPDASNRNRCSNPDIPLHPRTVMAMSQSLRQNLTRLKASAYQAAMNLQLLSTLRQIQFLQDFQGRINVGQPREAILGSARQLLGEYLKPVDLRIRDLGEDGPASEDFHCDIVIGSDSLRLELDLRRSSRKELDSGEIHIIRLAQAHLSLILDLKAAHDIVEEAARIDPLTGLYCRREIQERMQMEYQRCRRYTDTARLVFSILFMDLDHFKFYNDSLGHGAGDWILKRFSQLLKESIRSMDLAGRWGGDEFIILLPETDISGAEITAARILEKLTGARGFKDELSRVLGQEITLSEDHYLGCSIGIVQYNPHSEVSLEDLIAQADGKLYNAKGSGRGRSVS